MTFKKIKLTVVLSFMILAGMILSACNSAEPTIDIDTQRTGFAQTADVQATMTAAALPTATNTPEPTPTFTLTPEVTNTPEVTATEASQATSAPIGGADVAAWLANDPPDNTDIQPSAAFTVTWTLENIGTSTWTMDYYIEFTSGDQMGAVEKVYLPYPVPPNTNVQVSVDFTAPETEGTVQSDWSLVNSNNNAIYDFYVIIDVVEGGEGEPETSTETPEPTATP